jgi:hypothetical protein
MTKLGFVPTTKAIKYWSNASPGIWSNAEGTIPSIIWRKHLFFDGNSDCFVSDFFSSNLAICRHSFAHHVPAEKLRNHEENCPDRDF